MIQINYNYQIDPKKQTSPHIYKNFERNLFTSKTWLKKLKQTDIDLDKESTLIGVWIENQKIQSIPIKKKYVSHKKRFIFLPQSKTLGPLCPIELIYSK